MPELPDVAAYLHALQSRIVGHRLEGIRIANPFVLRSTSPPPQEAAGRLHRREPGAKLGGRQTLAAFDFANGSLTLTEAGSKRCASILVLHGDDALAQLDPGGLDVFSADVERFRRALSRENHTLKRALTDPHLIDGIGNAYSDELLHAARLSPVLLTQRLTGEQWQRLYEATRTTLSFWIERLRKPCPVCGEPVRRIRYADNETNYCAHCQTGGKILADRALSRLLR
jgi:formamidopyrimidine-DNA glycosylase